MPSPQRRINSGFGPRSTATEVLRGIDLSGRLAIVTGRYSGLGLETTRAPSGAWTVSAQLTGANVFATA
jgi:hypothetical protein